MGVFDWLREKFEQARAWVEEKVEEVKDFFAGRLGSQSSYSGESIEQSVDINSELAKFRKEITPISEEFEKNKINYVMAAFDEFANYLEAHYPTEVNTIKRKQEKAKIEISGTIINYVQKHVSLGDESFKEALAMQPGDEKKKKLKEKMDEFLSIAQDEFDRKLKEVMESLNEELGNRLQSTLSEKMRLLNEAVVAYEALEAESKNGSINFDRLRSEGILISDSVQCLSSVLETGEREAKQCEPVG